MQLPCYGGGGLDPTTVDIEQRGRLAVFQVRVTPRSSRNRIEGEYQGALKVRLTAPPADDKANDALRRVLAEDLNVPVSAVRIVAGAKNRTKRVAVAGVTGDQIMALIQSSARYAKDREKKDQQKQE
jgi:uncharacterized protein (TIGR00251 family)